MKCPEDTEIPLTKDMETPLTKDTDTEDMETPLTKTGSGKSRALMKIRG